MLALMRSSSSAVVARGEGWRFRFMGISITPISRSLNTWMHVKLGGVRTYVVEPGNALVVSPRLRIWSDVSSHSPSLTRLSPATVMCRDEVVSVRTTSWVCARKQVLSPDAPRSNTRDERREGEEGSLAPSALGCSHDQYTHNVYQVPGPEVTYTLARCAIKGRRHDEFYGYANARGWQE